MLWLYINPAKIRELGIQTEESVALMLMAPPFFPMTTGAGLTLNLIAVAMRCKHDPTSKVGRMLTMFLNTFFLLAQQKS